MRLIEHVRRWPVTRYVPTWVKRSIRQAYALTLRPPPPSIERQLVKVAQLPAREIEALVVQAYEWALERTPGSGERQQWVGQVQSGQLSAARLLEVVAASPEAAGVRARHQGEVEALVVRVYQWALDRTPRPEERELWTAQVTGKHLSAAGMVEVIAGSPEAVEVSARNQLVADVPNGTFVQFTYEYLLGRGAMASEIVHWDHRLNNEGLRRDQIVLALFAQRASAALTDSAKPVAYDPSLAHIMGTDRFISVKEWQAKAAAVPANPTIAKPNCYRSLKLQPSDGVLVSAIASLYRGGEFIEQFLENITSQTIFARTELIIVDADSPENEFAVISRYMERFPNIVYHRASTRIGIYEAWNLGVHLSKGRYITNTNLDDLRRVDSLERQSEVLEKFPFVDVVYQDFYFSFEGHASFDRSAAVGVRSEVPVITPYNLMQSNSPHNAPMWRRALHSDVGMFDASFRSAGDYDFWLRCVQARKTFFKVNDPHVIYFVNPEGLSTQPNTRGIDEANRITKVQGHRMISPWLLADDQAYIAEVTRRTGSDIAFADAARAQPDWRYVAAQQALRQLSADSRSRSTQ